MLKLGKYVSLALLAAPVSAFAGPYNTVDLYYVPSSDIEVDTPFGDAEDDGDGFGIKALASFTDALYFTGEYQSNEFDAGGDLDGLRAGVGYHTAGAVSWYGDAQFINLDADGEDDSGFGIHGGVRGKAGDAFGLFAEIGYLDVGDVGDGLEFSVGGDYAFSERFGAFIDYRVTNLENDDVEVQVDDIRLGGRWYFGA